MEDLVKERANSDMEEDYEIDESSPVTREFVAFEDSDPEEELDQSQVKDEIRKESSDMVEEIDHVKDEDKQEIYFNEDEYKLLNQEVESLTAEIAKVLGQASTQNNAEITSDHPTPRLPSPERETERAQFEYRESTIQLQNQENSLRVVERP